MTKKDSRQQQHQLLMAVLTHVPFDGWSRRALSAGGQDLGLEPAEIDRNFPNGVKEALEVFSQWADEEMLLRMEAADLENMKVRDRVALGVRARLEVLLPHREAVRRGMSMLALPSSGGLGAKLLYRTVDAIWYAAGDRATDYNFYTKRMLLAGVYGSTLLVWLDDKSEGLARTWAFLDRRIDEVLKIGGRIGKTMKGLLALPERLVHRRSALRR